MSTTRSRTGSRAADPGRRRNRWLGAVAALLAVVGMGTLKAPSASAAIGCATAVARPNTAHFRGIAGPASTHANCASELGGGGAGTAGTYPGKPPLTYHGGPVMSTPTVGDQVVVTPIFWAPSGYSFTSSYKNIIDTYLTDLAADSDKTTNVFATTYQYSQTNLDKSLSYVNYRMVAGTPITTTDAFPAAGCTIDTGAIYADKSGYSTCLDDTQVENEISAVVSAHGLTRDLGHLYVLLLPKGVESCFYPTGTSGQQCTLNYTPSAAYCAYHSTFPNPAGETVYATMPFPIYGSGTGYTCSSEVAYGVTEAPNGDPDADAEISPLSHEMAESMTDPDGNAWYDSAGYENGDDCAYIYGTASGPSGALYNQTVNGHHYLTQEEFSNADYALNSANGCQQGSKPVTPTVTGLTPSTGTADGGTSVTITGTGFPGATSVSFGSTPASFTIVNATTITATAPAGSAGAVDVTVSTTAGTSATSGADLYTFSTPTPTVTGVSPASGPTSGGTSVTITGTDLTGATAVTFGSHPARSYSVVDSRHITARAPAGAAGTVDVRVTTADGTSAALAADHFKYVAKPHVTTLSVHSGRKSGGTKVVISGTGFASGIVVHFGAKRATNVTLASSTHIVVHTPAHRRGLVNVTVTTVGGTSATVRADRYTFV